MNRKTRVALLAEGTKNLGGFAEVSESTLNDLLSAGQIKKGDIVWITYKKNRRPYDVVDVLMPGADREEILLDIDDNLYFITSMAIDGTSWAKDVKISMYEGR